MGRRRIKKIVGKRGKLFFDEGASKKLKKPTQDAGYEVKDLPPEFRNSKISDSELVTRFAKELPIVTDDYLYPCLAKIP